MAIIGFASVAGSPGVTTAAVAAALLWPRPVLFIEADTSNVSAVLPGLLRGRLDYSRSLSQAMLLHTRGELTADAFLDPSLPLSVPIHDLPRDPYLPHPSTRDGHRLWVVPGFDNLNAAVGTSSLWSALTAVAGQLADSGADMIVDFGRLHRAEPRQALLEACDRVVIVARATLPDLFRVIGRMSELTAGLAPLGRESHLRLLLISPPTRHDTDAHDFQTRVGVDVIATLPFSPRGAAGYSAGISERNPRNPYQRAVRKFVHDLAHPLITAQRRHPARVGASDG
ncbi:hypothetical protein [Microbacterium sp. No. 7]|uniref:hypothetical protein n=1 Tax=Microbacterium sp. No. 7 TaxID=1714373 RepID=UPI0006CFF6D2|nr:hypothetical protein [Microbacterium sp. No. 7]